ncbi:MAG: helix-turn-helix domain-containing protein [Muribaculaceae bacterium]|nr:helix-turn-helix domain-containing protein [Muribaculaceae bacterium]MDE6633534.1 helix-turn-helix domain-containing protein [Muribaculaceae bacterium]
MKIRIKNMVCRHCVAKVAEVTSRIPELNLLGVELGSVTVEGNPQDVVIDHLDAELRKEGFEVIRSREEAIVAEIKAKLMELSRDGEGVRADIAKVLQDSLHMSFRNLSRIFASIEGRTIENYFTALRIERIKELLLDDQLPLSEIAYVTGFSSVPHLSTRFKQATGMTPTQFREIGIRTPLPEV